MEKPDEASEVPNDESEKPNDVDSEEVAAEPAAENNDEKKTAAEIEDWLAFVCRNIDGTGDAKDGDDSEGSKEEEVVQAKEQDEVESSEDTEEQSSPAPEVVENASEDEEKPDSSTVEAGANTQTKETDPTTTDVVAEAREAAVEPTPAVVDSEPETAKSEQPKTITEPPRTEEEPDQVQASAATSDRSQSIEPQDITEPPRTEEEPESALPSEEKTVSGSAEPTVTSTISEPPGTEAELEPTQSLDAKTVVASAHTAIPTAAETITEPPRTEDEPEADRSSGAETIADRPDTAEPPAAEMVTEPPRTEEEPELGEPSSAESSPDLAEPAASETITEFPKTDEGPVTDTLLLGPAAAEGVAPAESSPTEPSPTEDLLAGPFEAPAETDLIGGAVESADDIDALFIKPVEKPSMPAAEVSGASTLDMKGRDLKSSSPPIEKAPHEPPAPTDQAAAPLRPTQPLSMSQQTKPEPETLEKAESAPARPKIDLSFLQTETAPQKTDMGPPSSESSSTETLVDLNSSLLKQSRKPSKSQESDAFKTTSKPSAPGANLKFLEQALAKTVPGKLPTGLKKRAVTAVRHLFTMENVQRVAVLAKNDQGEVEALAVGGLSPDKESLQQIPPRLLRAVLSSGKPLLLLDCMKEPRYAKDPIVAEEKIRSVICAPFTDTESGTRGLLYVDNRAVANAFSYQDLDTLTQFAHKVGTESDLSEYDPTPARSTSSDKLHVEVQPPSPWLYVGMLIAAMVLVMPALYNTFFGDSKPTQVQTSTNSQPIENPAAVIQGFIRALDAKSYGGAYTYLSEGLRERISEEAFDKRLKADLAEYDKAWRLSRVNIRAGSIDQESLKSFRVTVGHNGPWIWTLQKSEGKWYIHEFEGGLNVP